MKYASHLIDKAAQIRSKHLNSNDFSDYINTDENITVGVYWINKFKKWLFKCNW